MRNESEPCPQQAQQQSAKAEQSAVCGEQVFRPPPERKRRTKVCTWNDGVLDEEDYDGSERWQEPPAMGRTSPTLRRAWPRDGPLAAICVQNVDVQCVLQFTLIHAAGCVLHRRTSRVIHRLKLSFRFCFFSVARRALPPVRPEATESVSAGRRRPFGAFARAQSLNFTKMKKWKEKNPGGTVREDGTL